MIEMWHCDDDMSNDRNDQYDFDPVTSPTQITGNTLLKTSTSFAVSSFMGPPRAALKSSMLFQYMVVCTPYGGACVCVSQRDIPKGIQPSQQFKTPHRANLTRRQSLRQQVQEGGTYLPRHRIRIWELADTPALHTKWAPGFLNHGHVAGEIIIHVELESLACIGMLGWVGYD